MNTILLNGNEYHFSESSLPILIHGEDHVGASLFTISLVADLYAQGSKILFLSGYTMAKDEFLKQIGEPQNDRVVFISGSEPHNFLKQINELEDINERVILVKNVDLFDQDIFDAVANKPKVIVSGDIEKVPYKDHLLKKDFKTKIFFSPTTFAQIPSLNKWEGLLESRTKNGSLSLKIE